jgi:hypothetical protein
MQCMMCGARMHVAQVVHDRTASGLEHRTLICPACGETEQRLGCAYATGAQGPVTEIEASEAAVEMASGAWAQAVEKMRLRQAMLGQHPPAIGKAGSLPAQSSGAERGGRAGDARRDDFDQLWESLALPQPPPPIASGASHPAEATVAAPAPARLTDPGPSLTLPSPAVHPPLTPTIEASGHAAGPIGAWTRLRAMLGRRAAPRADAILHISEEALIATPRQAPDEGRG